MFIYFFIFFFHPHLVICSTKLFCHPVHIPDISPEPCGSHVPLHNFTKLLNLQAHHVSSLRPLHDKHSCLAPSWTVCTLTSKGIFS